MNNLCYFILGHADHGKDLFAKKLSWFVGNDYVDKSRFACEKFIFEKLAPKYGYKTVDDCLNDRDNHRAEWYNLISDYCGDDQTRLVREVLMHTNHYVGMRKRSEYDQAFAEDIIQYSVWVDRSLHKTKEPASSMDLSAEDCDIIIDNNDDFDYLQRAVLAFHDVIPDTNAKLCYLQRLLRRSPPHTKLVIMGDKVHFMTYAKFAEMRGFQC